jgi:glycosyltransferase involved in cell wall biosynthesis
VRIALDATYSVDPHPTGIGVYSNALLLGLADRYPEDTFIHCYRPKQFLRAVRDTRQNVRRRPLQPPLRTFRADAFHALNQRVDKRHAKRVVSTFHDLFVMTGNYSSPDFQARFIKQAQRAAQNSDLIVAVSQFTADQVSYLLEIEHSRIRVIPHGVTPPPRNRPERPREKMILFVGALQIRKNIERLVEAFERAPDDWRLILAGAADGYGSPAILERIEKSPHRARIQRIGYVSPAELQMLYQRASIFAFPSLDEGFGIPVLEAMAHGIPVITSNRSALVEVAADAALLIDPEQTEDLEHALKQLMQDPALRSEYAQRGRQRAKLYSWERAIAATYDVYCELIS